MLQALKVIKDVFISSSRVRPEKVETLIQTRLFLSIFIYLFFCGNILHPFHINVSLIKIDYLFLFVVLRMSLLFAA